MPCGPRFRRPLECDLLGDPYDRVRGHLVSQNVLLDYMRSIPHEIALR